MKIVTSLMVLGAFWGGYSYLGRDAPTHRLHRQLTDSDANGFSQVPPPANQDSDTVYVVAARNCPRAAAQRADRLARLLQEQHIPVERIDQVSYSSLRVGDRMDRLNTIMSSPLPLVFVHGRVASNPELDDVVQEYHRTG